MSARDPGSTDGTPFPAKEADTLTTHKGGVSVVGPLPGTGPFPSRRDTIPHPPSSTSIRVAPPPAPVRPSPRAMLAAPPSPTLIDDDDLLEDDDTQTAAEPFTPTDDPTSPTLSLESQSNNAREVYRLFLASEYAPALQLANELIAQGDNDPMLVTIARECQASLSTPSSMPPSDALPNTLNAGALNGQMTLEQLTEMTGMSLEQVLGLLERFVAMGVITLRPPPPRNR